MWTSCSQHKLKQLVEKGKNKGLFEVITSYPHKVYFDVDCHGLDRTLASTCTQHVLAAFPNASMAVSGSFHQEKTSLHIVLQNYVMANDTGVKQLVKSWGSPWDWRVYTSNRNMKCVNQAKPHSERTQAILQDADVEHHFITCFLPTSPLRLPVPDDARRQLVHKAAMESPFDVSSYPAMKLALPADLTMDAADIALRLLKLAPLDASFDHCYTHRVARFAYHNGLSFDAFWTWNKQKQDTPQRLDKWRLQWTKLKDFPPVSLSSFRLLLHRFYPDISLQSRAFRQFKAMAVVEPDHRASKFQPSKYPKHKFVIANLPMGFGKTQATISFLKGKEFLWITPRRSLARNTCHRLDACVSGTVNYLSLCSAEDKRRVLPLARKLVVGTQSLHYTRGSYPIVVIDEVESVVNSWTALNTHGDNLDANLRRFCDIIRGANKVILLDAFVSQKTLRLICPASTPRPPVLCWAVPPHPLAVTWSCWSPGPPSGVPTALRCG